MSGPIIFISNQRVKEGQLEGYAAYYREVAAMTEESKPGTVAHLAYASEDGREISILHLFPDAEAMTAHMRGVNELAQKAYEYVEIRSIEIYGRPSEAILQRMRGIIGAGIEFQFMPDHIGGYMRLEAG